MKRADVAKGADLSYPYISEIENGVKQPSVAALARIAEALGLSVSELAALSEQYTPEDSDRDAWGSPAVHAGRPDPVSSLAPPSRQPSQLLRNEMVHSLSLGGAVDDSEVRAVVRQVVLEELARWERDRLPGLVRAELRRRLDQAMGADDR